MKRFLPALAAVLLLAAAAGGFALGRATAPAPDSATFYAVIDEIDGSALTVTGLAVNDINSRGQFTFSVGEDTALEWRHTPLQLSQLEAGDTISITYTGPVLESYPAQLQEVKKIILLDDEI